MVSRALVSALLVVMPVFTAASAWAQTSSAEPKPETAAPATVLTPLVTAKPTERKNRPPLEAESYDFGVYRMRKVNGEPKLSLFAPGKEIEAKLGETFGFSWRLSGFTGTRLVPIRSVVQHPPIKRGDAEPTTISEDKGFMPPINGKFESAIFYRLETEADLVPGEWILSLYYDDQLMAEHRFILKK